MGEFKDFENYNGIDPTGPGLPSIKLFSNIASKINQTVILFDEYSNIAETVMLKKAEYDDEGLDIIIDFQYKDDECDYNRIRFNVKMVYFIDNNIVFCVNM